MQELILILIRQALALFGGWFAAHGIDGSSTVSIVVGLIFVLIPVIWSTVAKWLNLDERLPEGITTNQQVRVFVGALVSQGITALSAYMAADANDPQLLGLALANVIASKVGLHQAVAKSGAVNLFIACLCMLSLSSCATGSALIASPFGRALIATADQLGKAVIETTEKVGLEQIILQASAKVSALKAEGINADPVKEILRGSQISAFNDVIEAAQAKYQQLTGKRFTLPKNPVKVMPVAALRAAPHQNRPKSELHSEDGPGCMQLADRIPVYGERVAFMLSTAEVRN